MSTYKAVMRPALEYASSIWSPLASSTSINKLKVMQNAALRTATECTQDTNIQHQHDETVIILFILTCNIMGFLLLYCCVLVVVCEIIVVPYVDVVVAVTVMCVACVYAERGCW